MTTVMVSCHLIYYSKVPYMVGLKAVTKGCFRCCNISNIDKYFFAQNLIAAGP